MLFNFKYNFLVIIQVLVSTLNLLLLFVYYGVSEQSDIFLLSFSILSIVNLIQLLFTEQFIYYYNKIKIDSINAANSLFTTVFLYSLMISIIMAILIYFFSNELIELFASQYNNDFILKTDNFFNLLSLTIIFYLPLYVMQNVLNANDKISFSYIISIFPQLFISFGFLYLYIFDGEILELSFFYFIGTLISFIMALFLVKEFFNLQNEKQNLLIKELVINSFKIRLAHNIYGVLSILIINNFLSSFPSGYLSIFHYAKKASDTILNVIYGPTHKVLINVISTNFSKSNIDNIEKVLKKINLIMPIILIPLSFLVYILIPYVLDFFHPMDSEKVDLLKYTFLILMLQVVLLSLEVPYAIVNLTKNDSNIFYISNFSFIIFLFLFVFMTNSLFNFYSLPVGLCLSQIINYYLIRNKAKDYLRDLRIL